MMNMHSKNDNMQKNGMNYALKYPNNNVISSINFMLSKISSYNVCKSILGHMCNRTHTRLDMGKISVVESTSSRIQNYTQPFNLVFKIWRVKIESSMRKVERLKSKNIFGSFRLRKQR